MQQHRASGKLFQIFVQQCCKTHDRRSRSRCKVQRLTLHVGIRYRGHIYIQTYRTVTHSVVELSTTWHPFSNRNPRRSTDAALLQIHSQERRSCSTADTFYRDTRDRDTRPLRKSRTLVPRYSCQLVASRVQRV